MQIEDMKVLVTGGGQGMGRTFVLSLAADGADVAFCDLNEEAIAEVVSAGESLPGRVVGFACDAPKRTRSTSCFECCGIVGRPQRTRQ